MTENNIFLNNGWNFPPTLDTDGTSTRMSAYKESIHPSLWTQLNTLPRECVHSYDYDCPVRRYVSEIMDFSMHILLHDDIEQAVVMFEPLVDLNLVDFEMDEAAARPAVKVSAKPGIKSGRPFGRPLSKAF